MSKQMLELADRLSGSLGPFNFLSREERDLAVTALRQCSAESAQPVASSPVVAWECTDERHPAIKGIVTDRHATVDAWLQSGIEFAKLGRIIETPQPVRNEPQSLPVKLTGEIACILEDCSPPDKQTPEAVAALIEGYQPTWDRIRSALTRPVCADEPAMSSHQRKAGP